MPDAFLEPPTIDQKFTTEADICHLLATGAADETVCGAHRRLNGGLSGAGQTLVGVAGAAMICAHRPHLAERVLARPVELFLENGYGDSPHDVIRYGKWLSQSEHMPRAYGPTGVQWLRDDLPQLGDMLGRLLWEGWAFLRLYTGRTIPELNSEQWVNCADTETMVQNLDWHRWISGLKRTALAKELLRAATIVENSAEVQDVLAQFDRRLLRGREIGGAGLAVRPDLSREVTQDELGALAPVIRDIFGNPFRPVPFSPFWRSGTTLAIAFQMYDSRDFGAMPILADALQDAGCDNTDILDHCRDTSLTHVRGCWVVDLVLGKN